jgi:hypothetical protein
MRNYSQSIFFVIFVLMILNSCMAQDKFTVNVAIENNTITNEQVENTLRVLKMRLQLLKDQEASVFVSTGKKHIVIESGVIKYKKIVDALIIPGKLFFSECYTSIEANSFLLGAANPVGKTNSEQSKVNQTIDDLLNEKPDSLFTLLNLSGFNFNNIPTAEIGFVAPGDTALVGSLINNRRKYLPADVEFLYGKSQNRYGTNLLPLYAVKANTNHKLITNELIDKASVDFDYAGKPTITIILKNEGAALFANMTKNNVNRSITIVIDNVVYSAPIVMSEITGGNVQISGLFSVEEAQFMSVAIAGGHIPLSLKFLSWGKIEKK